VPIFIGRGAPFYKAKHQGSRADASYLGEGKYPRGCMLKRVTLRFRFVPILLQKSAAAD